MPFRARYQGNVVVPAMVPDGETVECLDCGGTLYQRGGPERAQHFYHPPQAHDDPCIARDSERGESETHARCVALAVDALTDAFDGQYERCQPEVSLDVSRTPTPPDRRRADALLEFADENPVLGRGVILEVQYKHHTKDRQGTTHDYLWAGYSVAWLDADEFAPDHLDYAVVDEKFRDADGAGFTARDHDPHEFDASGRDTFDWEVTSRGCWQYREVESHAWFRVPAYAHPQGREYEACRFCDARRRYDDELTRYVYDYDGLLAPEFDTEDLREGFIQMPKGGSPFGEWVTGEGRYSDLTLWEDALLHGSFAPCRGGSNFHVWSNPESIEGDDGTLWQCENCPACLLVKEWRDPFILFGKPPEDHWHLESLEGNPRRCNDQCHTEYAMFERDFCPTCRAPVPIDEPS